MSTERNRTTRERLLARDFESFAKEAAGGRNTFGPLFSFLSDPDTLMRRRAAEAMGRTAAVCGAERAREAVRRLLWMMNDESSNYAPNAPDALGEILLNRPELMDEIAPILHSFADTPPFEAGVMRAARRLAALPPAPPMEIFLNAAASPVAEVRAAAAAALAAFAPTGAREAAAKLLEDESPVEWYDYKSGEITLTTVARLARRPADAPGT